MYQHKWHSGETIDLTLGKIVCVGRNYAEHVKELNNEMPEAPLLFMKPATSAVDMAPSFTIPAGNIHHEVEIALLIKKEGNKIKPEKAWDYVGGVGIGLDLTLRDLQGRLKSKGHPWELAKAFDGACPLSKWIPLDQIKYRDNISIVLKRNGEVQQSGSSEQMIVAIPELLAYMSEHFTLQPGDVVLTGTPSGVGPILLGDQLKATLDGQLTVTATVNASKSK